MAQPSVFPFPIRMVSNSYVKLVPFEPTRHSATFFRLAASHPELFAHMPMGPWNSEEEFKAEFYQSPINHILSVSNPESFVFAVIDKTRQPSMDDSEGELAGTISFVRTSATHLCTEIGFIVILPPYQHTHVAKTAVCLALQYALEDPGNGGLGLRRVHWRTSTKNIASAKLAERLKFEKVGTVAWHMRFVKGKMRGKIGNGKELPPGSDPQDIWRDTVNYTLSWDQWKSGSKDVVCTEMERMSSTRP